MKRKRYRITPYSCRLDKVEQICERMQQDGFALSKCGRYLMHFTPSSERYVYRAERSKYFISGWNERRCEYDEAYDAKGWLCIPGKGELRVYRAVEGVEPPDIPQQSRTNVSKSVFKSNAIVLLVFLLGLVAYLSPLLFNIRGKFADSLFERLIEGSFFSGYFVINILISLTDMLSSHRLYRANKLGERLPQPGFPGIVPLAALFISVLLVFFVSYKKSPPPLPLPTDAENRLYFVYSDLGIGLEDELAAADRRDYIKRSSSLFAQRTETYELLKTTDSSYDLINGNGIRLLLSQNIYKLRITGVRERLVETLINANRWFEGEITEEKLSFEGFDEVLLLSDGRLIAVKGPLVAEITYYCISPDDFASPLTDEIVLNALAERWNEP